MTVKKAIKGLEMFIQNKQGIRAGMLDPEQPWNKGHTMINDMAKMIADGVQTDLDWLCAIKRQLLSKPHLTKTACQHPKKDHDMCDGQKYCMNCNKNL